MAGANTAQDFENPPLRDAPGFAAWGSVVEILPRASKVWHPYMIGHTGRCKVAFAQILDNFDGDAEAGSEWLDGLACTPVGTRIDRIDTHFGISVGQAARGFKAFRSQRAIVVVHAERPRRTRTGMPDEHHRGSRGFHSGSKTYSNGPIEACQVSPREMIEFDLPE